PKDPMRDVFIPKGSDVANWIYAAEEYRLYEAEILTLKARMDELREKQASTLDVLKGMMADYYNADYCGVKITKYTVAGRIDYKKILEQEAPNLSAVDIEKFREAREVRCRVSITDSLTPKLIIDPEVIDPVKDLPKEIESFYW
ncbi:endonuclease, partial [Streptomyces sp. G35A]